MPAASPTRSASAIVAVLLTTPPRPAEAGRCVFAVASRDLNGDRNSPVRKFPVPLDAQAERRRIFRRFDDTIGTVADAMKPGASSRTASDDGC
jgi:hypothetical protein